VEKAQKAQCSGHTASLVVSRHDQGAPVCSVSFKNSNSNKQEFQLPNGRAAAIVLVRQCKGMMQTWVWAGTTIAQIYLMICMEVVAGRSVLSSTTQAGHASCASWEVRGSRSTSTSSGCKRQYKQEQYNKDE
jgi:hypothetical protein